MSAETDLIKLYSTQLLALAADIPHTDRLEAPKATVKRRAPLCGSTVTVDLDLDDTGRIARFGQDVKACALGQAAAAIVGAHIIGRNRDEVQTARDALRNMLKTDGPVPGAPFERLELLRPAVAYKNRHDSICLALEATLEAMDAVDSDQSVAR